MKSIGIVGSRRRDSKADLEVCRKVFLSVYEEGDIIVSGGCKQGGDRFAEIFIKEYNIPEDKVIIHYPDKSKLDPEKMKRNPRWAYAEINYARNTLIARDSDILIAVVAEDRKGGTEDTIKKAKKMQKTITYVPELTEEDRIKYKEDDFDPYGI